MRSAERLLTNLRYEDALSEADEMGFNFPTTTSELLQQAIQAFSEFESFPENHEEEVKEEIIYEWEDLEEISVK